MPNQPTPAPRKQLTLSPKALAAIKLPLSSDWGNILDGHNRYLASVTGRDTSTTVDAEIAAFIAALLNEALTPAEPVRMCADRDCLNAADPTTAGGAFCLQHDAELRAELRVQPIITTEYESALDQLDSQGVTLRERLARR